jgi:hypothetical protein
MHVIAVRHTWIYMYLECTKKAERDPIEIFPKPQIKIFNYNYSANFVSEK